MNPRVRYWLGVSAGCILALWVGSDVAQESYLFPAFISLIGICAFLVRSANVSLDALVLGLTLVGYLVGNRGFAQFMPFPRLPLLPAEMALGLTGGWLIVKCAFARHLPWRNDALNWAVVGWMLVGTVRVLFDLRAFGLIAVRDFAMIYYAGFFFIAQALSAEERSKRFLQSCLAAAAILRGAAARVARCVDTLRPAVRFGGPPGFRTSGAPGRRRQPQTVRAVGN